jgi:hypothetical protein
MNIYNEPSSLVESSDTPEHPSQPVTETERPRQRFIPEIGSRSGVVFLLVAFALGLGSGYLLWGLFPSGSATSEASASSELAAEPTLAPASEPILEPTSEPAAPVNRPGLPNDYTLPVPFGDIGPQLLAAGAIDYDSFVQVYEQAGQPLTEDQLAILAEGSDEPIVINRENAYFLLNFFWALGLTNQNVLLEEGPMMQYSEGEIERFASTGGWTLATKPVTKLYASTPIITLTPEQQARLEEVAQGVYRPCCNNPTAFPDCNHGMAMLGLLELMASQGATVDEMFTAAKQINAFWFPRQTLEIAMYFKSNEDLDFDEVDARQFVGGNFSSSTGFQGVHQWLSTNGQLEQLPDGGNSCGV